MPSCRQCECGHRPIFRQSRATRAAFERPNAPDCPSFPVVTPAPPVDPLRSICRARRSPVPRSHGHSRSTRMTAAALAAARAGRSRWFADRPIARQDRLRGRRVLALVAVGMAVLGMQRARRRSAPRPGSTTNVVTVATLADIRGDDLARATASRQRPLRAGRRRRRRRPAAGRPSPRRRTKLDGQLDGLRRDDRAQRGGPRRLQRAASTSTYAVADGAARPRGATAR